MRIPRASTRFSLHSWLLTCLLSTTASIAHATDGQPTGWTPWQGHHYRVEADGQFACLSEDGRHCSIAAPGTVTAAPLRCDRLPKGKGTAGPKYQGNGHRRKDHWCNKAYASLFAPWADHSAVGHPLMLSTTPRGDRMCLSYDGTRCLPGDVNPPTPTAVLNPLVCGRPMQETQQFGSLLSPTDPQHWCQSDQVLLSKRQPALSHDGDYRYPQCSATFQTPGWRRTDAVDWIVRMRPGVRYDPSSVTMTQFTVSSGDWLAQAEVQQTGGVSVAGERTKVLVEAAEELDSDQEGRVSIGIRQDDSERIHYFGATGWPEPDALFRPEAELVKQEEVLRRGSKMIRPRSPDTDRGQVTVMYQREGTYTCDDKVFERIDMIRRSPKP